MGRLRELLKTVMAEQGAKCLIFCETKRGCDEITRTLRMDGWPALALHGDKSQKERDWVLLEFKSGRHPLMLATDVAARGLGRQSMGGMGLVGLAGRRGVSVCALCVHVVFTGGKGRAFVRAGADRGRTTAIFSGLVCQQCMLGRCCGSGGGCGTCACSVGVAAALRSSVPPLAAPAGSSRLERVGRGCEEPHTRHAVHTHCYCPVATSTCLLLHGAHRERHADTSS